MLKIEILEISAPELLSMLDSQNPVEICQLLIRTLALQVEKLHYTEIRKEIDNELADAVPELVLNNYLFIDSLKEGIYESRYYAETDVTCSEIAEMVTDAKIKEIKGE